MYKEFPYIPETFELTLNFKTRKVVLEYEEPTYYQIFQAERFVRNEDLFSGVCALLGNTKIKEADFRSNPYGIYSTILKQILGEKKNSDDPAFIPSIFDVIGERYGKTPLEIIKEVSPSILATYTAGMDYNSNLANEKDGENAKYKEKGTVSEDELAKADEIIAKIAATNHKFST